MHRRWFWLVTVALLPLYLWTMTETSAVRVQVAGDRCTALLRQSAQITRTSTIVGALANWSWPAKPDVTLR